MSDDSQNGFEDKRDEAAESEPFIVPDQSFKPESTAETTRKSGLAWSMGIVFFGSIVFMMVLGWGFDLFFGSSPWGLVGGIVLGSVIGFLQFFRISSQIYGNSEASRPRSIMDDKGDDQ